MALSYITGKVVDIVDGKPMQMVNVFLSDQAGNEQKLNGVTVGRTTGTDGSFTIPVSIPDSFVTFSYVGYKPLTIPTGSAIKKTVFKIASESSLLDEVPIIGGLTKKAQPKHKTAMIIGFTAIGILAFAALIYLLTKKSK